LKKILVLGIGNVLMGDDGAGIYAVNKLKEEVIENECLKIVDGGTLGLDLLNFIEWANILIIIDAIDILKEPGTIIKTSIGSDLNLKVSKTSHEIDLEDLLFSAKLLDILPEKIIFFGIQVKKIIMKYGLSREVENKLDELSKHIKRELSIYL
jgi:hydrogenase maturation protease